MLANIISVISALSGLAATGIAFLVMLQWRKTFELKAKMEFKKSIFDYTYVLTQLPEKINNNEEFLKYATKLDELNNRLATCLYTKGLAENLFDKQNDIQESWDYIFSNTKRYLRGEIEKKEIGERCVTILNNTSIFS